MTTLVIEQPKFKKPEISSILYKVNQKDYF